MSHCYRQLRLVEREAIFRMKDARLPVRRMCARISRSTRLALPIQPTRRNWAAIRWFHGADAQATGAGPSAGSPIE